MNQSTATGTAPAGVRWFAYAAALWAFLFAALSFYWGLGGRAGAATLDPALMAAADDPWFVAIGLWGVGVVKALGGLVALALVLPWGRRLPGWFLRTAAWAGGGLGGRWIGAALWRGQLCATRPHACRRDRCARRVGPHRGALASAVVGSLVDLGGHTLCRRGLGQRSLSWN